MPHNVSPEDQCCKDEGDHGREERYPGHQVSQGYVAPFSERIRTRHAGASRPTGVAPLSYIDLCCPHCSLCMWFVASGSTGGCGDSRVLGEGQFYSARLGAVHIRVSVLRFSASEGPAHAQATRHWACRGRVPLTRLRLTRRSQPATMIVIAVAECLLAVGTRYDTASRTPGSSWSLCRP